MQHVSSPDTGFDRWNWQNTTSPGKSILGIARTSLSVRCQEYSCHQMICRSPQTDRKIIPSSSQRRTSVWRAVYRNWMYEFRNSKFLSCSYDWTLRECLLKFKSSENISITVQRHESYFLLTSTRNACMFKKSVTENDISVVCYLTASFFWCLSGERCKYFLCWAICQSHDRNRLNDNYLLTEVIRRWGYLNSDWTRTRPPISNGTKLSRQATSINKILVFKDVSVLSYQQIFSFNAQKEITLYLQLIFFRSHNLFNCRVMLSWVNNKIIDWSNWWIWL